MENKSTYLIAVLLTVLLFLAQTSGLKAQIANKYPHDSLIQTDSDVLFTEMFEESSIPLMMMNWNQKTTIDSNILFDPSTPSGSTGTQSLKLITVDDGTNQNENTFIYKKISPDIKDSIFVRYYIRYDTSTIYHHSGLYVGGKNPASSTAGLIGGILSQGNKEFHVGSEIRGTANGKPTSKSLFGFYNYWMGMHPFTTGPFAGAYYGNEFFNSRKNDSINLDTWNCIEIMIRLNNPISAANGELKLWINGTQINHLGFGFPNGTWNETHFIEGSGSSFEGFQWRNDTDLNLNYIWLKNFNDVNSSNHKGTIYFDHLVVAKKYIGPISKVMTAVSEVGEQASILIYPNPANDIITFTKKIKQISIFNIYGQMVMQAKNAEKISVKEFEDGMYYIQTDNTFHKLDIRH